MAEHALTARRVAPPVPPVALRAAAAAPADGAPELLPRAHDLDNVPPAASPLPVAGEVLALEAALHARSEATAEHGTERDAEAVPWVAPGARSPLLARRAEEAMWLATEAERLASDHGMDDDEFERRLLELYPALEQHPVQARQRCSSAAWDGEGAPPPHAADDDDDAQGSEGKAEAKTEGGGVVELIIRGASAVGPRGGGVLSPLSRCDTPGQGERHRASTERPAEPAAALEVGLGAGAGAAACEARGDAMRMQPASRPASRDAARVATPAMRAPRAARIPPSDQRGVKPGGLTCEAEALTAHLALPPTTSEGRGARRGSAAAAAHRPAAAAAARVGGEMEDRAQSLQALQALLIDIESEADSDHAVERSDARPASRERSFNHEVAWTPPGSAEMAGSFVAPGDI